VWVEASIHGFVDPGITESVGFGPFAGLNKWSALALAKRFNTPIATRQPYPKLQDLPNGPCGYEGHHPFNSPMCLTQGPIIIGENRHLPKIAATVPYLNLSAGPRRKGLPPALLPK